MDLYTDIFFRKAEFLILNRIADYLPYFQILYLKKIFRFAYLVQDGDIIDQGRKTPDLLIGFFDKMLPGLMINLLDRKSTRLNSSHTDISRMPSSA